MVTKIKIPDNFYLRKENLMFIRKFFFKKYLNFKKKTISNILNKKNQKILDIGCGEGLDNIALIKNNFFYGFDMNLKTNIIAKTKGYNVSIQDINNFKYKKKLFDSVLAFGVYGITKSSSNFIKNINKVCKKNGEVYMLAAHLGGVRLFTFKFSRLFKLGGQILYFHTSNKIQKKFTENGFHIIKLDFHSFLPFVNKMSNQNKIKKYLSEYVEIVAQKKYDCN